MRLGYISGIKDVASPFGRWADPRRRRRRQHLPPRPEGFLASSAPTVWPPLVTYGQMRGLAAELLPGSEYRRHLLLRYSVVWREP
ncbi:hypothetical protein GCM10010486_37810 [Nonomuraea roseoviolacea subsp. carminata]|uniref:Uncharacterized protein n=1 Tax=Nonomuraea roseoviolacea subsp. carminata TaxID=160689 RepID=A0ABT1KBS9_9ACTN|nr:hypothetical protein [Nonomuraea roseoviolacea subsp. carminata]